METIKELPPHIKMRNEQTKALLASMAVKKDDSKHDAGSPIRERWMLFNRLIDVEQRRLTDSEFRVLLTLFRDTKNGIAQTAQSDLAMRTGKCRGTIVRAIKRLVEKDLIEIATQGGLFGPEGKKEVSEYRVKQHAV